MLPNFLHIGVAKAASTWLWTIYKEHPEIYVPSEPVKNYSGKVTKPDNVNFFVADFFRGLEWYEKTYFSGWKGEKAVGETSNSYMLDELALSRIASSLPEVKLTMTLRNPIEIAYLQYLTQKRSRKWTPEQYRFEEVLDIHAWQLFRMWIEPGFYHLHLTRVYRYFPRERVLVLFYDDLLEDPRKFLRRVFSFLGVKEDLELPSMDEVVGFPRPNTGKEEVEEGINADLREKLRLIYRDEIRRLEELVGRDLSSWC